MAVKYAVLPHANITRQEVSTATRFQSCYCARVEKQVRTMPDACCNNYGPGKNAKRTQLTRESVGG